MKKLLIVVDMQNDFVTGSLGSVKAQEICPGVEKKVRQYLEDGEDLIFTRDTHGEDYLTSAEGKKLPVPHCIKGDSGWEIIDSLKPYAEVIFDKPSFGSLELTDYVKEKGYEEIELVGLCTDICVVSNALLLKAALPEAEVAVDSACCAGVTEDSHQAALKTMEMCQVTIR